MKKCVKSIVFIQKHFKNKNTTTQIFKTVLQNCKVQLRLSKNPFYLFIHNKVIHILTKRNKVIGVQN